MAHVVDASEVDDLIEAVKRNTAQTRDPSKHPQPLPYVILRGLCDRLRPVLDDVRDEPVVGVLASHWLSPQYRRVPGTNLEVVTVGRELFPFCDHVAKRFAELLNPRKSKRGRLLSITIPRDFFPETRDGRLAKGKWVVLALSYAALGGPLLVPPITIGRRQQPIRSGVLDAIELFAIAHEYGHSISNRVECHSDLGLTDTAFSEDEYDADRLGQELVAAVGAREKNSLAQWGFGPSLLLPMLDVVHEARHVLATGREPHASTSHPSTAQRLERLRRQATQVMPESDAAELLQMFTRIDCMFESIRSTSLQIAKQCHDGGLRPHLPGAIPVPSYITQPR